jgi:hypothetical protein
MDTTGELERLRRENERLNGLLSETADVLKGWPNPNSEDQATAKARRLAHKLMGLE